MSGFSPYFGPILTLDRAEFEAKLTRECLLKIFLTIVVIQGVGGLFRTGKHRTRKDILCQSEGSPSPKQFLGGFVSRSLFLKTPRKFTLVFPL